MEVSNELEHRLTAIETKLDTYATKAELHAAINDLTWRLVAVIVAVVGAVYWMAKNVH